MADTVVDATETERAARALLDSRIDAVRELAVARQQTSDLQEALAAGQRADSDAYAAALRAGWSAEELKKLGFTPARPKPTRTRSSRTRPPAQSATEPKAEAE
jgi:hypothetical protein